LFEAGFFQGGLPDARQPAVSEWNAAFSFYLVFTSRPLLTDLRIAGMWKHLPIALRFRGAPDMLE
jgi:hypothetical protein